MSSAHLVAQAKDRRLLCEEMAGSYIQGVTDGDVSIRCKNSQVLMAHGVRGNRVGRDDRDLWS